MKSLDCDKMIIAILQNDDYRDVIEDLNEHGFYVTVLHSSGGFLKQASSTIMIGLNHEYLDEALDLLKHYGKRTEMRYMPNPVTTLAAPLSMATASVPCGGIVMFVLDVAQYEKY